MKLGDYVINFLADKGIDKIFVVYGAANGDLIDAFTRTNKTSYVAVMHEQAGGFAAEGYAKTSGRPGAAIATSGPGGHNFVTPIANCFYDSVSAIFITGQVNSKFLRNDDRLRQIGFQETDIVAITSPITKYSVMVTDPNRIRYELERAYHLSVSGRPGPVLIDLPIDVQRADIEPDALPGFDVAEIEPRFDFRKIDAQIEAYLDELSKAERPALLVGGGVRNAMAVDVLRSIGDLLKVPMFPTWNALDVVTSDYPYYGGRIGTYGGAGRNFGLQNSDLLLAVGSRISGRITGGNVGTFVRGARKYLVDIDDGLLVPANQQVPFDVNIHCDAREFLSRLLTAAKRHQAAGTLKTYDRWLKRVDDWKRRYDPAATISMVDPSPVNPYQFVRVLSQKMRASDIIVADCGGNIVTMNHCFETKHGQRYFTNNGNSPMGFSFAGAIGAALAAPDRRVICVIGDGGFNMNMQELQTLLTYGIPVKTIILNNHIYGITKAFQETNFKGRSEACGPKGYVAPDFVKIVQAYGIETISVMGESEVNGAIERLLSAKGPIVCDVNIHEFHTYEPRTVGWKSPIEDMYPYLSREEFRENMLIDPVDGWMSPTMPDVVRVRPDGH